MKKGIVIKNSKNSIVVLSDDSQFVKLKSKPDVKIGQEIYYFKRDEIIMKYNKIIKVSSLVAALLVVILAVSLLKVNSPLNLNVYAIVTVDINPSVELSLDANNLVIDINSLNEDAKQVISDDMIGKSLDEVVTAIIINAHDKGFLLEDGAILVSSVILNDKSKSLISELDVSTVNSTVDTTPSDSIEEVKVVIEDTATDSSLEMVLDKIMVKLNDHYNFMYVKGTPDALTAAKSQGLSLGKAEILRYLDDDITQVDIKDMKVAEIAERKEIRALSKSSDKDLKFINKGEKYENDDQVTQDENSKIEEESQDDSNKNDENSIDQDKDSNGKDSNGYNSDDNDGIDNDLIDNNSNDNNSNNNNPNDNNSNDNNSNDNNSNDNNSNDNNSNDNNSDDENSDDENSDDDRNDNDSKNKDRNTQSNGNIYDKDRDFQKLSIEISNQFNEERTPKKGKSSIFLKN